MSDVLFCSCSSCHFLVLTDVSVHHGLHLVEGVQTLAARVIQLGVYHRALRKEGMSKEGGMRASLQALGQTHGFKKKTRRRN